MGTGHFDRRGEDWAVALHSGTLQGMVAVRMLLKSGLCASRPDALGSAAEQAVRQLEHEIGELRELIAEIRSRRDRTVAAPTDAAAPSP